MRPTCLENWQEMISIRYPTSRHAWLIYAIYGRFRDDMDQSSNGLAPHAVTTRLGAHEW